jgi:hypothetical protein
MRLSRCALVLVALPLGRTQTVVEIFMRSGADATNRVDGSTGAVVSLSQWARANRKDAVGPAANSEIISVGEYMGAHAMSIAGIAPIVQPTPASVRAYSAECYAARDGSDYGGDRNVTQTGKRCALWSSVWSSQRFSGRPPPTSFCRKVDPSVDCAACVPICHTHSECRRQGREAGPLECCDIGPPQRECGARISAAQGVAGATPSILSMTSSRASVASPSPPPLPPPLPTTPPPPPPFSLECYTSHDAKDYRGTANVTANGFQCQHWTSQWPNVHPYRPDSDVWESAGLGDHNYCRRPGGFACAWCLVDKGAPPVGPAEKSTRRDSLAPRAKAEPVHKLVRCLASLPGLIRRPHQPSPRGTGRRAVAEGTALTPSPLARLSCYSPAR